MDVKQNPFSFYDFLGYLTPGSILLYGIIGSTTTLRDNSKFEDIFHLLSFEKAEIYIPFILAAYVLGHIIAFISSITIERYSLWSTGYPSKYLIGLCRSSYFEPKGNKAIQIFLQITIALLLLPISIIDTIIGHAFGAKKLYAKQLDPLLRKIIKQKIEKLITTHAGIEKPAECSTPREADYFRYVYHFTVENCPAHLSKMQNYVALYGFLRALTLLAVIASWSLFALTTSGKLSTCTGIIYISFSSSIAYILYLGFVKFYRRFTLEALMAFAVTFK